MTCEVSNGVMQVKIRDWGVANKFWVARRGAALLARDTAAGKPKTVPCGGPAATVGNVDRILVRESNPPGSEASPSSSSFELDMKSGLFAPGDTSESTGHPEIEVFLDLPQAAVSVAAPSGENRLRFGAKRDHLALNVNSDNDLDIEMRGPSFVDLFAGKGNDAIDARTGSADIRPRRPRLFLWGQRGADRIVGGGQHDQLIAGRGADVLIGSHGATQLDGGSGPDDLVAGPQSTLIQGKSGNDFLRARNHHRDWISCGPGNRDRARADHREENIGGCEHAPSVLTRF
jgi:hemolysin type calcium-binding protein